MTIQVQVGRTYLRKDGHAVTIGSGANNRFRGGGEVYFKDGRHESNRMFDIVTDITEAIPRQVDPFGSREMEIRYAMHGLAGPKVLQQYRGGKWENVIPVTAEVLKPKFPQSLLMFDCAGIAMDQSGTWYMYEEKPHVEPRTWQSESEYIELFPKFVPDLPKLPEDFWEQSWIPHPNRLEPRDAKDSDDNEDDNDDSDWTDD